MKLLFAAVIISPTVDNEQNDFTMGLCPSEKVSFLFLKPILLSSQWRCNLYFCYRQPAYAEQEKVTTESSSPDFY